MKLEMKHTTNIVIELATPLPCAASFEDKSLCQREATKTLGTMNEYGFWEIVPLCDVCWEQVESQLVSE